MHFNETVWKKKTQKRSEKQINIKLVLSTLRYLWAYKIHSLGEQGATALAPTETASMWFSSADLHCF